MTQNFRTTFQANGEWADGMPVYPEGFTPDRFRSLGGEEVSIVQDGAELASVTVTGTGESIVYAYKAFTAGMSPAYLEPLEVHPQCPGVPFVIIAGGSKDPLAHPSRDRVEIEGVVYAFCVVGGELEPRQYGQARRGSYGDVVAAYIAACEATGRPVFVNWSGIVNSMGDHSSVTLGGLVGERGPK